MIADHHMDCNKRKMDSDEMSSDSEGLESKRFRSANDAWLTVAEDVESDYDWAEEERERADLQALLATITTSDCEESSTDASSSHGNGRDVGDNDYVFSSDDSSCTTDDGGDGYLSNKRKVSFLDKDETSSDSEGNESKRFRSANDAWSTVAEDVVSDYDWAEEERERADLQALLATITSRDCEESSSDASLSQGNRGTYDDCELSTDSDSFRVTDDSGDDYVFPSDPSHDRGTNDNCEFPPDDLLRGTDNDGNDRELPSDDLLRGADNGGNDREFPSDDLLRGSDNGGNDREFPLDDLSCRGTDNYYMFSSEDDRSCVASVSSADLGDVESNDEDENMTYPPLLSE